MRLFLFGMVLVGCAPAAWNTDGEPLSPVELCGVRLYADHFDSDVSKISPTTWVHISNIGVYRTSSKHELHRICDNDAAAACINVGWDAPLISVREGPELTDLLRAKLFGHEVLHLLIYGRDGSPSGDHADPAIWAIHGGDAFELQMYSVINTSLEDCVEGEWYAAD